MTATPHARWPDRESRSETVFDPFGGMIAVRLVDRGDEIEVRLEVSTPIVGDRGERQVGRGADRPASAPWASHWRCGWPALRTLVGRREGDATTRAEASGVAVEHLIAEHPAPVYYVSSS